MKTQTSARQEQPTKTSVVIGDTQRQAVVPPVPENWIVPNKSMISAMITFIIFLSQQTVSVFCGIARTLFRRLRCEDNVQHSPVVGESYDRLACEPFIVPKTQRTFAADKYDKVYISMAHSVVCNGGTDSLRLVRELLVPTMRDERYIMLAVDILAHINSGADHTLQQKVRKRFTREQRRTIWHNNLKSAPMKAKYARVVVKPKHTSVELQTLDDFPEDTNDLYAKETRQTADVVEDIVEDPVLGAATEAKRTDEALARLHSRYDDIIGKVHNMFARTEVKFEYSNLILPVAVMIYNVYRSRNVTDALVAVVSFAERVSVNNGHARARAAATWATSFISGKRDELLEHLKVLCKHFHTQPKVELQSENYNNYIDLLSTIASGISKSAHVRAFVYLTAFAFMGVTASVSCTTPDINSFSKRAMEICNMVDVSRTTTGTTFNLLTQAMTLCAELCTSFMRDGFQAFWSSDAKALRAMHDTGKELLLRASKFAICWAHKDMIKLGEDLKAYIDNYNASKPRFDVYRAGARFAGISFDSETNLATMWHDVRKIAEGVISQYEDFKAVLASVSFRRAPMCVSLIAGSSVGKSSVTQYLAKWFLLYEEMSPDMKYVYTVNPNQKFLDGYYPWQSIFVLDDVATVRPEYMKEGDPQVLGVIQYVNNIALLTNQADLSRKATTPFMSKYVMLTSNQADLCAHKYAHNYPAILRRVKWFIHVDVDSDFCTGTNTLDSDKCSAWYAAGGRGFPPFWRFTVKLCQVHNDGTAMRNTWTTMMDGADANQLQEWLRKTVDEHWKVQDVVMKNVSSAQNISMCRHCKKLSGAPHSVGCPFYGGVAQSSLGADTIVVTETMVASTAVAATCAGVMYALRWLWLYVHTQFVALCMFGSHCHYSISRAIAFAEDLGYTIALVRETLEYTHPMLHAVWKLSNLFVKLAMFTYMPLPMALLGYFAMSQIPSRSAVIGRVGLKQWLRPLAGLGIGVTAVSLLWYLRGKRQTKSSPGVFPDLNEHADESDFTAYVPNPTWGQGRRKPYEGESLVTVWPTGSKCSAGASHDGVMEKFKRNQFVVMVKSIKGTTRGNGFVYKSGYVVINHHTLRKHIGHDLMVTLAYQPQENDLGAPGDEKPRNYTIGTVTPTQIYSDVERDLAMLHMPMETRGGLKDYVLDPGSANFGMDPMLIGRDMNVVSFVEPVAYKSLAENVMYGDDPNKFFVKKCVHYNVRKELRPGHSGSLYVVHSGRRDISEYGFLAIAGIHMGCMTAIDGHTGFVTVIDSKILGDLCHNLITSSLRHTESVATALGPLGPAFARSATLHSDVRVEDSVFDLEKGSIGGKLGPTHPKSAVTWLDYNPVDNMVSLAVYGSVNGDSRKAQGTATAYRHTPWSTGMVDIGRHEVLGDMSNQYRPAKVNTSDLWQVHRLCLLDLCGGNARGPDADALEVAIAGYVGDVIQRVELAGNVKTWSLIQPLSYHEVINGRDGVFDGIVKKTGGGFGYSGPKRKHVRVLEKPIEGLHKTGEHWTFDDDVMSSVQEADELLRQGVDPRFVYTCHLKDEVRAAEKIDAKKIRMICGASIPCIVLMRKYLLSLIIFMQQNPVATECAVGLNVESKQWSDLAEYLRAKGGDDRYIAGDYKSFDKNQTFPISYAASRVMLLLVEHANLLHAKYSAEDLLATKTILYGLCHPTYDFFGILVRVLGTNPSGNTLTTQRNCVVNSLYMRCAFVIAAKLYTGADSKVAIKWYSKAVSQMNYGDDLVAAVAKGFGWFSHDVIAYIMRQWGITFTHADKTTDIGRPYDLFKDVVFVKRSWVYDREIGGYMAPLDSSSLVKSLHYYHQGNTLSIVQQQVCLIRDVAENALNYGRDDYDTVCTLLRELASKAGFSTSDYAEATNFTTFDAYIERYKINSVGNHKFVSEPMNMEPPRMLDNIGAELSQLIAPLSGIKEGSFNPYGNGQPPVTNVNWGTMDVVTGTVGVFRASFSKIILPIINALAAGEVPPCDTELLTQPYDHVVYDIGGVKFMHLDTNSKTVRVSMVNSMSHLGGYIQYSVHGTHDGKWTGSAVKFSGPASAKLYELGGWNVMRRSTMMPGEGYRRRVTRVECVKGDVFCAVAFFTIDLPRVCGKRTREEVMEVDYVPNTYRPRGGDETPPLAG